MEKFKADLGVAVFADRGPEMHMEGSGGVFYVLDPRPEEVHLKDIMWALSRQNRYNGHIGLPHYSVAEHCCRVHDLCRKENRAAGLMHDAVETYIGDRTRPMKLACRALLPEGVRDPYDVIAEQVEHCVFKRFGIAMPLDPEVKQHDVFMAAVEKKYILKRGDAKFPGLPRVPKDTPRPQGWVPARAYYEFLQRAQECGLTS